MKALVPQILDKITKYNDYLTELFAENAKNGAEYFWNGFKNLKNQEKNKLNNMW